MAGASEVNGRCRRCGEGGARVYIAQELLCDRCADRKTADITGLPELPDPPPDETLTGPDGPAAEIIPWPGPEAPGKVGSTRNHDEGQDWELEDEEEFLAAWERAEASAVDLLRGALPELLNTDPHPGALQAACDELRSGMRARRWPCEHIRRAAGWKPTKLPNGNLELWLGAVGGFISPREETGLDPEEEASIMALQHADWLGAVVGLVRAGVGASAEPGALVDYINDCPEVEGTVDPDKETLIQIAFELVLPTWEAARAVDARRRLTPLGRWGLPRALASAWNRDFDDPAED